jgi:hypothetical protein
MNYFWENGVSDLGFRWELAEISHHVWNFLLLDEVLLLVVEKREALIDFGLQVFLATSFLGHGQIVIPQHMLYN